MADWNLSRDGNGDREHSGGNSRPPLPRPDNGNNVCPVPLWEREFCRNAYDIPWATFCLNKRFIRLYKNVMDWDDSGALKNFLDAKERFRAKYFGEPFEDPVLDPDMYLDVTPDAACGGQRNQPPEAVGRAHPYCTPNNSTSNFHGVGQSNNRHQQGVDPGQTSSGTARMLPGGSRIWIGGASGAMKWSGGGGSGNGGGRNCNVGSGGGGGGGIVSGRNWSGGMNWNCFGRRNKRNQNEGQHQQRNSGGMLLNQDEERHQMRSGSGQQQGQRGRKMEWCPVRHNRAPKDDPAA